MADDGLCPVCSQLLGLDGHCLECPPGAAAPPSAPAAVAPARAAPPAPAKVPRQVGGIMLLPMMAAPVAQPPPSLGFDQRDRAEATFHKVDGERLELDEGRRAKRAPTPSGRLVPVEDAPPPERKGFFSRIFGKG